MESNNLPVRGPPHSTPGGKRIFCAAVCPVYPFTTSLLTIILLYIEHVHHVPAPEGSHHHAA